MGRAGRDGAVHGHLQPVLRRHLLFARQFGARDYVTFFKQLLGPGWVLFEGAYILFMC
jgi:hypothetical protein